jgi:hypothetical protein
VGSPKIFNVHLGQKVPFVLACFHYSSALRLENPDSAEKDVLFGFDTQITIQGVFEVEALLLYIILKKFSLNLFSKMFVLTEIIDCIFLFFIKF